MSEPNPASKQITVRQATSGWRSVNFRELYRYRDLFFFLVLRDIKALYKQTVLGFAWAILRPLFSMVVFTVIFGNMVKIKTGDTPYAIFSYAALVPWTYFSTAVNRSTTAILNQVGIFTKVYCPRLFFPLVPTVAGLVDFVIALTIVFALMLWYGIPLTLQALWAFPMVLMMIATAAGLGMLLSSMAVQYRDVKHGNFFLLQLLMYAAPVIWPADLIPEKFRLLYGLYPMAGVVEGFRSALVKPNEAMPFDLMAVGAVSSILVLFAGLFMFQRKARFFADVA